MKTERTQITPLQKIHFDDVLKMYFEKDTWKFISPHAGKDLNYYKQFLKSKVEKNKTENGFWAVYHIDGDFIGTINLNQFMDEPIIHMGVHLRRDYWGQGYATELMERLLLYAFDERKLKEVYAVVVEENEASRIIFEKLGFKIKETRKINEERLLFYAHT